RMLGKTQGGMQVVHAMQNYLGKPAAQFIEQVIQTSAQPGASAVASILSLGIAVYGASNLFEQLSEAINFIWKADVKRAGLKGFLLGKIIAVAMYIVFAAVFVVWLAIDSWLGWMEAHTAGFQGWQFISILVSIVFLTFVFALSFRAIPKGMVAWGDVWIGAIITAVGFAISKFLLSLYFSYSTVSAAYGSAGSLVVILLWIYYSAQIYFFGIELTCTYAHLHGSQAHREKGAPPVPVPASA
ncbi:MAG: rane protein, partial [Fimbriimonadaceae bacterium]|nr:rane protein [Fimbriimonadaceae bacterium]